MDTMDWPDKQDIPYRGLIRVLPPGELSVAVARTVRAAAASMASKEAAATLDRAAADVITTAGRMTHAGGSPVVVLGEDGDDPPCGNDLSWLYWWLHHHPVPGPGPDPDPWYDLATVAMIGLVAGKVTGPASKALVTAAQQAAGSITSTMG